VKKEEPVPLVNIVDELFVVASPTSVRAVFCDAGRWARWLPGVTLTPYDDRGPLGVRWAATGALQGTAEVWLEEHGDGTIVHAYLRGDPAGHDPHRLRGSVRRVNARYAVPLKRALSDQKRLLEGDRAPGTARVPLGERVVSASEDGRDGRPPRPQRPTGTGSEGAAPDGRPDDVEHPDRR
jgi:hypothetical protein